ncbi:hypothetical protein JKP88DRAFT_200827 [Tribonema minus]|uniref:SOUL heme-binding protein n=1 Tax=Tribonema minus TaxID=303371 RepID=A0A835YSS2_9STRA|nr:hypothetical protein JKP88DRAFT_200827 [Tribonema minus]
MVVNDSQDTHISTAQRTEAAETPLELGPALTLGLNRAIRGDSSVLRQVLSDNCSWKGPVASYDSRNKIEEDLRNVGSFLSDPRFTVASTTPTGDATYSLEWLASATWPLPWTPRIVIQGRTLVRLDSAGGRIISMEDTWEEAPVQALIRHLLPGFWDIWNQFCSPIAERYPHKVLRRGRGYEVWQFAPRLVLRPTLVDRTNSRQARMAYVLPDFSFTSSVNTRGRVPEKYFTTSPIEAEITPLIETNTVSNENGSLGSVQTRANRITWAVQVPASFGLEAGAMPDPRGEGYNPLNGDAIEFERQDRRVVAVANYNGSVQDKEAVELRAKLLEQLSMDKAKVALGPEGRPKAGFMSFDGKVGFNKQGRVSIAVYEYRPKILGKGNKVYVELEE